MTSPVTTETYSIMILFVVYNSQKFLLFTVLPDVLLVSIDQYSKTKIGYIWMKDALRLTKTTVSHKKGFKIGIILGYSLQKSNQETIMS